MNKQAHSLSNKFFIMKHMCLVHLTIVIDYLHQQQTCLSELYNTYKGDLYYWAEWGTEEVPEETLRLIILIICST